jgi:prolyl oligopeptidase family protein
MRSPLLPLCLALVASGCIWTPNSRTTQESGTPVSLTGFAFSPGEVVTFSATDHDTGAQVTLPCTATASTSPTTYGTATGYEWQTTCNPGASFWSPQSGLPATSLGRLELTAYLPLPLTSSPLHLYTFTSAAATCTIDAVANGANVEQATLDCSDGQSLVMFDNDGVGSPPETQGWSTTDLASHSPLPSGATTVANGAGTAVSVAWQVGNYEVQGNQIYGLVCYPTSLPGPFPVLIANHGLPAPDAGTYQGIVGTTWTGCTTMAANGWLSAVSTYRGETISGLPEPYSNFGAASGGGVELCLGEVTDVLRLTSLVTSMPNANPNQVLMWGHSHGACITTRAIEQQANVQIAVEEDGPNDLLTWPLSPAYPGMGRQWRSPTYFENDVVARKDVKLLMVQAEGDTTVPPAQACELAAPIPTSTNYFLYVPAPGDPPGVLSAPPSECASAFPAMKWATGVLPSALPSPALLMYSGFDHASIMQGSWGQFASFVNGYASSAGWHASIPPTYVSLE